MRLLDLFCGAGGAAKGYADAGFEVVGVDIEPQPNYPYEFIRADALEVLSRPGWGYRGYGSFDAIHASPPCQAYTHARHLGRRGRLDHPHLIEPVRGLLIGTGLPYVIENVEGSPLRNPVMLCGSAFGLGVQRHRLFECSFPIMVSPCWHGVHGEPRFPGTPRSDGSRPLSRIVNPMASEVTHEMFADAMGIDWMPANGSKRPQDELSEAIPPAYTLFLGEQLMAHLNARAAA